MEHILTNQQSLHQKRIPDAPPRILPLRAGTPRPLWSVMIPVYNCHKYLREALESVLVQDPGPEQMQIEVIDDNSTDGDVEALVRQVGKGRVRYFRQQVNQGSLRNFETCINRAQGHYLHLLHGDDLVKEGFYQEIKQLFTQHPEAGAAFTSHIAQDELRHECTNGERLAPAPGVLPNWLHTIAVCNRLQPPAIVVKRDVYEQLGAFHSVTYGEDWLMWVNIATRFPFAYSPRRLALYRKHVDNLTSISFLSGQNITDMMKVISLIRSYLPHPEREQLISRTQKNVANYMASTARRVFNQYGQPEAALIQAKGALKIHVNPYTVGMAALVYIKYILQAAHGMMTGNAK